MAVLALPGLLRDHLSSASFRLSHNTVAFVSPLNGTTRTKRFPGAHWSMEATLTTRLRAAAEDWNTFLAELEGMNGRFYAGDPLGGVARGTPTGTPLVNGASQTGGSLITDGWGNNSPTVLDRGDYFAVDLPSGGRSLHKIKAAVSSDGGGQATLTFTPNLRESPADDEALILTEPTCVMRLIDDDQAEWAEEVGGFYQASFAAVEAYVV